MKSNPTSNQTLLPEEMHVLHFGSDNGILVFRINEDDVFICRSCNPKICSMLHSPEEKLLGNAFEVIFGDEHFAELRRVVENLLNAKTGYPIYVNLNQNQYKVLTRLINREDGQRSIILSFNERWRYSPMFYANETLLNAIQDAIFIFDVGDDGEFRLNFLNKSHMKTTGLNLERDSGKTPRELVGEEDGKNVVERYQICVDTQESLLYEEELFFPTHRESTWWQTQISPVIVEGKVVQVIGSSRDITAQKQAANRIESLYLEYEALFNETAIPIWMVDVPDENNVTSIGPSRWNKAYERVFGPVNPMKAGISIEEYFVEPKLVSDIYEKYQEVISTRKPITFEFELPLGDSTIFTLTTLTPVIREGKVKRIIGSSVDISEEKRNYAEIERLYLEYEALFTETAIPIWVEDVPDENDVNSIRLQRYNPTFEETYGFTTEENAGKTVAEIFTNKRGFFDHPRDVARIHEMYEAVLRKREPITIENEINIHGQKVVNYTTLTPVIRNGHIVNLIGSIQDITELRQYQDMLKLEGEMLMSRLQERTQVLEETYDDQDDMLTSITMGYQAPLTSILGLVEVLDVATPKEDSRSIFLEQIKEQLNDLVKMTNTILANSQTSVEEALRIQEFNVKVMVEGLLEDMIRENPEFEGRLFFEDHLPMKMIWHDQQRISRILRHMNNKAFQRMKEQDTLTLETHFDPETKVVLLVGRLDLSPSRFAGVDPETSLQQFDEETLDLMVNGLDVKLILMMVEKVGGNLSYEREGTAAKVTFSLPLIHQSDNPHR